MAASGRCSLRNTLAIPRRGIVATREDPLGCGRSARVAQPRTSSALRATVGFAGLAVVGLTAGCTVERASFAVPDPPVPVTVTVPAAPAVPDGPLSAADVVRLVRERNPSVARAAAALDAALGGLDAAESALMPRLSAEMSLLRANAPSLYLFRKIDSHRLPPTADFNDPGGIWDTNAAVAFRWNVWDGSRSRLAAWAADADAQGAGRAAEIAANAISAVALDAYLAARAAADLLVADDASVRNVESQVAETRTRVEGGGALRSDLLSLEVRSAEARERRIRTDVSRRLALTALRSLLDLPAGTLPVLAGGGFDPGPLPASPTDALAEAFRRRPELAAARRAVEAARMRLEAARRGDLPRVDLEARTWADSGDALPGFREPNWMLALAVSYDLYDGGANGAAARRAAAMLRDLEEADRAALVATAAEVETALLRLEEANARVAVTAQAVAASEESLGLVETQFRGGSAPVTRWLETENARTSARAAAVGARLALDRAHVDLARALGRLGSSPVESLR